MGRKNFYKLHRRLSILIALPVLCWALSGFMHPLMTNIRPRIATQSYVSPQVDTAQLRVSLGEALRRGGVDSIGNARIVHMGGQQFYQVAVGGDHTDLRYFSTLTGSLLKNGDELYARYLARYFLEGGKEEATTLPPMPMSSMAAMHDCCVMATLNIMKNDKGAPIRSIESVTTFTPEYKYINRLLPAYRVWFDRKDGIRVYVATANDGFGFAVDHTRAAFDTLFGWFHTWEWMNGLGHTKYFIMVAFTLLGFSTTLMGLSIFFTTRTKKPLNASMRARRNHRYTSLVASLFTLMFTFSGGYHALQKIMVTEEGTGQATTSFAVKDIGTDERDIYRRADAVQNISLVSWNNKIYWKMFPAIADQPGTDRMKMQTLPMPRVLYVNASDHAVLKNGDEEYAKYLAQLFSGYAADKIASVTPITKFTGEYGFVNKRLPVWEITYDLHGRERYYVETGTGALAAKVRTGDMAEGYSFAFLHKHHYMDFAGKTARDISTMVAVLLQVAMVVVGVVLWRVRRIK